MIDLSVNNQPYYDDIVIIFFFRNGKEQNMFRQQRIYFYVGLSSGIIFIGCFDISQEKGTNLTFQVRLFTPLVLWLEETGANRMCYLSIDSACFRNDMENR